MPFPAAHVAPPEALEFAAPLEPPPASRMRTPAEEARTLVAGSALGTLSTLSEDGSPWGSLVGYGQLVDGAPVLLISTLAEHGRNLYADARTSLVVTEPTDRSDPLDAGRVTVAGRVRRPDGDGEASARAAYLAAVPEGRYYADFGDFSLYVLDVERVRWVGGYGRMDSCTAAEYHAAEPDPVGPASRGATAHMNADHTDALLAMARTLAGFPDATAASCKRFDRYGLDLWVTTPRGAGPGRVAFPQPCTEPGDLRAAAVEATNRARAAAG